MKIGVLHYRFNFYTYTSTIINRVSGAEYVPVQDLYSNLNRAANKLNRMAGRKIINPFDLNNQFNDFNLNRVDLLHFFNGISYGQIPWISNFESFVPRLRSIVIRHQGSEINPFALNAKVRRAMQALAGDACKQIIALSECSAAMQRDLLNEFPAFQALIEPKIVVMHPPQAAQINDIAEKPLSGTNKIRFMLVGAAFFRKGGRELLLAFEKMVRQYHYPLELILVTSLRIEDYAAKETPADVQWALAKIAENQDWITHLPYLPNAEVMALMKTADVGLLPSYADTYGLSVLEFQSCACPVITSNVRALPEMNHADIGWLIEVPKNRLGEAIYSTVDDRQRISTALQNGLETIVHEIFADPACLRRKGAAALAHIQQNRSPLAYGEAMKAIYESALS